MSLRGRPQPVLGAPQHQRRRSNAMQPVCQLRIALRVSLDQLGETGDFTAQPGVEGRIRSARKIAQRRGRIVRKIGRQLLRHDVEQAGRRRLFDHKAGGRDEHNAAQPLWLAHREFRGQPSAEGVAGQVEGVQPHPVEQIHVKEDVIVDRVECGRVAGISETGMVGNDHFVPRGPASRDVEAGKCSGAVKEDQFRSAAHRQHNSSNAVDIVFVAQESGRPVDRTFTVSGHAWVFRCKGLLMRRRRDCLSSTRRIDRRRWRCARG